MRHKKSGRKFGRNSSHREAMLRNMARSLVIHERIRTTEHKAKELRGVVERLITLAQTDSLHARRLAYKFLANHQLVARLFDEIGPRFRGQAGGYTRVVKMGLPRAGDCAPMAVIELTRMAGETAAPKAPKSEAPVEQAPVAATETAPQA